MRNDHQTTDIAPWLVVTADPGWIYAQVIPLPEPIGGVGLVVYKSTWLKCTDSDCRPVVEFLGDCETELLQKEIVVDPDMVHGKAELYLYQLTSHDKGLVTQQQPIHTSFSKDSINRLLDR